MFLGNPEECALQPIDFAGVAVARSTKDLRTVSKNAEAKTLTLRCKSLLYSALSSTELAPGAATELGTRTQEHRSVHASASLAPSSSPASRAAACILRHVARTSIAVIAGLDIDALA